MTNAPFQVNTKEPITFHEAMKGLKKLAIGKPYDTLKFRSEMLEWSRNEAKKYDKQSNLASLIKGLARELG